MGNNPIVLTDSDGGCTTCPKNAKNGDVFNHSDYGKLTYKIDNKGNGYWVGNGIGAILDDATVTNNSINWTKVFYSGASFMSGMGNAWGSNQIGGFGRAEVPYNDFYEVGQFTGDIASLATGGIEMFTGAGMTTGGGVVTFGTAGAASPVSVPAAAAGVAIATHGAAVQTVSAHNLSESIVRFARRGKGERKFTGKASGTNNPFKHLKKDPNKPGNVIYKHPQTGKKISRPATLEEKIHFDM